MIISLSPMLYFPVVKIQREMFQWKSSMLSIVFLKLIKYNEYFNLMLSIRYLLVANCKYAFCKILESEGSEIGTNIIYLFLEIKNSSLSLPLDQKILYPLFHFHFSINLKYQILSLSHFSIPPVEGNFYFFSPCCSSYSESEKLIPPPFFSS